MDVQGATKKALNDPYTQHYQCASGYCDSGWNTSKTDRCMPNMNGSPGDICSHNNQCASRVCVDLHAQGNVWIPGLPVDAPVSRAPTDGMLNPSRPHAFVEGNHLNLWVDGEGL